MIDMVDCLRNATIELVQVTEYRTKSELLTSAYFFTLPRDEKVLDVEAFATLFMAQLCHFEAWDFATFEEEDFRLIEQNHLKTLLQAEVHGNTAQTVEKINLITDACVAEVGHQILCNNQASSHVPLDPTEIVSSVLYFDRWNHIEAMLKTKTQFLYFSWATGP